MVAAAINRKETFDRITLRRVVFFSLVALSVVGAIAYMSRILAADGISILDIGMLVCFALTLPWTMIGFWNAVIGFGLLRFGHNMHRQLDPVTVDQRAPLKGRTAILMTVYNEDTRRIFKHLGQIASDLDTHGLMDKFDIHLLSDTRDLGIAREERRWFERWQREFSRPDQLFYRRRLDNTDHKNGNLWEFLERCRGDYDYFILLDADSLMSAEKIQQMVRRMDVDPQLGIYQSLIAGLPNASPFARIFQFGMRQGMRAYTAGSVWWQGISGPCWGHNVIVRMEPFIQHCTLPRLAGSPPLGGLVLSHDQIEAAMMRGAGYDVRVVVDETGSYEENPPTLQDFITRDLRWCQGNMQYFGLLRMPGVTSMGRMQIVLAILMYVAAPAWLGFMGFGLAQAVVGQSLATVDFGLTPVAAGLAIGLLVMMMTINLTPKVAGMIDLLCRRESREAYGGSAKIIAAAFVELLFSLFLGPIVAVAQTVFIGGLLRGRAISWDAQRRSLHELSWSEALVGLWPQTLVGAVIFATLWIYAPAVLPWAAPVYVALLLAIPFAWLTSRRWLGEAMVRAELCATPEERVRPAFMTLATPRPIPEMDEGVGQLPLRA